MRINHLAFPKIRIRSGQRRDQPDAALDRRRRDRNRLRQSEADRAAGDHIGTQYTQLNRHKDRGCLGGRGASRHFCRRLDPGAHVPGAKRHASDHSQDGPKNVYALCSHAVVPPTIDSVRAILAGKRCVGLRHAMRRQGKEITHSRQSGEVRACTSLIGPIALSRENSSS